MEELGLQRSEVAAVLIECERSSLFVCLVFVAHTRRARVTHRSVAAESSSFTGELS